MENVLKFFSASGIEAVMMYDWFRWLGGALVVLALFGFFEKKEGPHYHFLAKRFGIVLGLLLILSLSFSIGFVANTNLLFAGVAAASEAAIKRDLYRERYIGEGFLSVLPEETGVKKFPCYRNAASHLIEDLWNKPFYDGACKQDSPVLYSTNIRSLCPEKLPDSIHSFEDYLTYSRRRENPHHALSVINERDVYFGPVWVVAAESYEFLRRAFRYPVSDGTFLPNLTQDEKKWYQGYFDRCDSYAPMFWLDSSKIPSQTLKMRWYAPLLGGDGYPQGVDILWLVNLWPLLAIGFCVLFIVVLVNRPFWKNKISLRKWRARLTLCLLALPIAHCLRYTPMLLYSSFPGNIEVTQPSSVELAIKIGSLSIWQKGIVEAMAPPSHKYLVRCLAEGISSLGYERMRSCKDSGQCLSPVLLSKTSILSKWQQKIIKSLSPLPSPEDDNEGLACYSTREKDGLWAEESISSCRDVGQCYSSLPPLTRGDVQKYIKEAMLRSQDENDPLIKACKNVDIKN